MTLKSYMRVFSAAIALLLVAVGCKDSEKETPPPSQKYTFDIAVQDIRATDAAVKVTPSDELATYYCSVVKKVDFDKQGSDEAYLKDDIKYLKDEAEKKNLDFKDYLKTVIAKGSEPIKFITLEPSTDYYAYVYGITVDGQVTSDLKKAAFTTEAAPEPEGLTFEFKVENITMTAADINVIPSDDQAPYYFDVIAAAAYEGMTDEEILADVLADIIPAYLTQGPDGYPAEIFEGMLALLPGTEYLVYAIGYDAAKEEPTSGLQMYKFSTLAPTGEAPDLTFSVRAGDASGNNTSTNIYCVAQSSAAVSAKMAILPKEVVDEFIGKGASLENIVDNNGQDIASEDISALNKGGLGLTVSGEAIVPSTDYAVIFKVVSAGGMSTVKREDVSTTSGDYPSSDLTFTIDVTDLKATSATVTVTPSNNTEGYFFDVQPKDLIDESFSDDASLIAALDEVYAKNGGIAGMLSHGEDSYKPTGLTAGTSYYVLAFGYNTAATTAVTRHEFTTETAAASDLTLSIDIDAAAEPIPGGVTATISASNDQDPYMLDFMLADDIEAMTDAEIISTVEEKYGAFISWLLVSGNYATAPTDFGGELAMMPGAEYYLVAFGYDGTTATTGVTKAKFTAGAGPDAAGIEFTFKVEDITSSGATVTVGASKEPVAYMWDVIPEAKYTELGGNAAALASFVENMFTLYGSDQYGNLTPTQVVAAVGAWYSGAYYEYGSLLSKTSYRAFAACVDLSGKVIGTPAVSDQFTTLEAVVGSATAAVSYDKYFDGDEVVAAGGSPNAAGKAYVPCVITASADAVHWYVGLYTGDYTVPGATASDAAIINALKSQGAKDRTTINFICSWDTQCTFLAVAEDAAGNAGEIFRLGVRFTKSGASPIGELTGSSKSAATAKRPVLCTPLLDELTVPTVYRSVGEPTISQIAASRMTTLRQERASAVSEKLTRGADLSGYAGVLSGAETGHVKCTVGRSGDAKQTMRVSLKQAASTVSSNPRVRTPRR